MTITAKFPSRCACCGGQIRVGEKIEWTKGSPAKHVACAGKPAAEPKAERKPRAPKVDTTGCQYLSRRSQSRDDGYDVGQVLRCPSIPGGGGDGRYWTVVSVDRKWRDDDTDEWMVGCYARPSTSDECAEPMARRAAKAERAALETELAGLVRSVDTLTEERIPAAAAKLVLHQTMAGSRIRYLAEGAVYECESSYDDAPRTWMTRDPRAVEIMGILLGGAS